MNTQQVASRLAELCRTGDWKSAHNELYANDAVSIEPYETPGFPKETKGIEAIRQKGDAWDKMVKEVHSIGVSEPQVAGNAFSVVMDMDLTMANGKREKMSELCVYETKDGKVTSERFFM